MIWIYALSAGYLAGSIPTGVLLGRFFAGGDPREAGSGNIGASNVTRTLGKKWGALTLLVDVAKGALPTWFVLSQYGVELAAWTGFAAVVGHCFPVWLKFRGGKGVATAFGIMVVLAPIIAVVGALAWIALVFFTRIPTIGSLVAAGMFPVLTRIDDRPFELHVMTIALLAVIVLRHTHNVRVLKARYIQKKKLTRRR